MEPLTLALLPSILSMLENSKRKDGAIISLKKLFLIECRTNLKIIAALKWRSVSDDFKKELIKSLQNETAKALFSFSDKSHIKFLLEIIKVKENKKLQNEVRIVSIISKIEILKVLSNLKKDLQLDNRASYSLRIKNLEEILVEIAKELEQEIAHSA